MVPKGLADFLRREHVSFEMFSGHAAACFPPRWHPASSDCCGCKVSGPCALSSGWTSRLTGVPMRNANTAAMTAPSRSPSYNGAGSSRRLDFLITI